MSMIGASVSYGVHSLNLPTQVQAGPYSLNFNLHENLIKSSKEEEIRKVANIWTSLTLSRLDAKRKRHLVDFLRLSKLIEINNIVDLSNARLYEVDLSFRKLRGLNFNEAYMEKANMVYADLTNAVFRRAYLVNADLTNADLTNANLTNADLTNADLTNANLTNAIVTDEQLRQAKSLQGATMPDWSIHE